MCHDSVPPQTNVKIYYAHNKKREKKKLCEKVLHFFHLTMVQIA